MSSTGEFAAWGLLLLVIILGWVIIRASSLPVKPGSDWHSVEGVAYIFRVDTRLNSNGEELSEPGIRCIYRVNHKTYTISLDGPGFWHCTRYEWENIERYWPKQCTVRVHYDPQNPRRAVVTPNYNSESG